MFDKRSSGILLHPSSLPGRFSIGTLGKNARRFIDFLAETGQKWWQILPLGPVSFGNSPYQCFSAFAGNPLLIDPEEFIDKEWIAKDDITIIDAQTDKVDYECAKEVQLPILYKVFEGFLRNASKNEISDYRKFLDENGWWLNDYALFMACKKHNNDLPWNLWDQKLIERDPATLIYSKRTYNEDYERNRFIQYLFFKQWLDLKRYANQKDILIIGDLPLYVSYDSSDVWANQDLFFLDEKHEPTLVGGVPPDYFSETGQLWGNPVYNWEELSLRNYDWWIARLHFNIRLFDRIRIDHFRGLEAFWAIPATADTAVDGSWMKAKGLELLSMFQRQIGAMPILAEDLGLITPEVIELRNKFDLPGMKVLQFAFGSDGINEHLPQNYTPDFVAYTGTHDNDTSEGWYEKLKKKEKHRAIQYLLSNDKQISHKMMRTVWASTARVAIAPLQDVLGLDSDARMNTPGTVGNNWEWRFQQDELNDQHRDFLKHITLLYNRSEIKENTDYMTEQEEG
ncbi:MAG: 4-alpha-glucanotransferase, partial [Bacteroidota bacterium]|nr:4-alpha-glucanotransferase [Bacteroidota bacterium]